ncbi:hypothetical protein BDW75DRAFT_212384 [Aspergillus navahoensis]
MRRGVKRTRRGRERKFCGRGRGNPFMEGQARTTTKRAGSNPWLAVFVIGHRGVICPTPDANSSPRLPTLGVEPFTIPTGTAAQRDSFLGSTPPLSLSWLRGRNFLWFSSSLFAIASTVDSRTEMLGINALVAWRRL